MVNLMTNRQIQGSSMHENQYTPSNPSEVVLYLLDGYYDLRSKHQFMYVNSEVSLFDTPLSVDVTDTLIHKPESKMAKIFRVVQKLTLTVLFLFVCLQGMFAERIPGCVYLYISVAVFTFNHLFS